MIWMDVDTALSEVPVNAVPLIDDTDFKTIETAVAYNAAGLTLYWHFVTTAGAYTATAVTPTTAGNYDWAHQQQGMYTIEIPASGGASINNDTEGFGYFTGVATGVLPWRGPTIGFRAAGLNNALVDDAWSTTRGLAGTALPAAAADAAGGLPISDAGGLDLDSKLANTNEITAARMGALTDWIDGGRLDLILDAAATAAELAKVPKSDGTATWNATALASIQSEANDALVAQKLDHLVAVADADDVADDSIIAKLANSGATADWSAYVNTTDSLMAIRDRGDAAWITATGFSTHAPADVWSVATRVLTANTNLNDPTAAAIADAVWDEAIAGHLAAGSTGEALNGATAPTAAAVADAVWDEAIAGHLSAGSTGEALNAAGAAGDPWTTTLPGAYGAGSAGYIVGNNINAMISSRSSHSAADVWAAATRTLTALDEDSTTLDLDATIRAAVGMASANIDTQLSTIAGYIDTEIGTIITHLTDIKGATFSSLTDSLEAIRDRGDAAWTTATGFSTLDAAGVRAAVGLASANLDTQLADIPTNAELATALASADDTTLAAISALQSHGDTSWATATGFAIAGDAMTLTAGERTSIATTALTTQMTEAYRANGAAPTMAQAFCELLAHHGEAENAGTTKTLNKLDHSTPAMTFTYDDATTPTSVTRAT